MDNSLHKNDLGFTRSPSRRQDETALCSSPATSSTAPWTTARCKRLLRPLSSKIALLRKAKQKGSDSITDGQSGSRDSEQLAQHGNISSFHEQFSHWPVKVTEGAQWDSSPRPLKKVRRTYSSRAKKQGIEDDTLEDQTSSSQTFPAHFIGIPQKLIAAMQPPNEQSQTATTGSKRPFLEREKRTHYNVARTEERKLVEGTCKGLEALLLATAPNKRNTDAGSRSLFSTCLRQVPRYIDLEEQSTSLDDSENELDVASDIYNELEALGSIRGGGWKPLREIVRVHGIETVGKAIHDDLFDLTTNRDIVRLCVRLNAYDEAQHILERMRMSLRPEKRIHSVYNTTTDDTEYIFACIEGFALFTGKLGFLYRETATMLREGLLSSEWMMSKKTIQFWNGVILSVAQNDDHTKAAMSLLRTATSASHKVVNSMCIQKVDDLRLQILKDSRRSKLRSSTGNHTKGATVSERYDTCSRGIVSRKQPSSTISNILTVISAIRALENAEPAPDNSVETGSSRLLQSLAIDARAILELYRFFNSRLDRLGHLYKSLQIPLLAAGLPSLVARNRSQNPSSKRDTLLDAMADLPRDSESNINIATTICAIARCCAQAKGNDPFETVQSIVDSLSKMFVCESYPKDTQKFWTENLQATALMFAEDTGRPDHLNWALDLELSINGKFGGSPKTSTTRTPARGVMKSNSTYRWEEGICEWIFKTPATVLQRASELSRNTVDTEEAFQGLETSPSSHKQVLPLLSEWSPTLMHHKQDSNAKGPDSRAEAKALCVCVASPSKMGNSGDRAVSGRLRFRTVTDCAPKNMEDLKPFQDDLIEDSLDELSARNFLPSKPKRVAALRELVNVGCKAKRRSLFKSHDTSMADTMSTRPVQRGILDIANVNNLDMEDELSCL
ncbi:hypothetical protein MMC21_002245 [Puttea exsequens]|nr:hypothetical protein [Puttea exsequens]